jgi:hypothetical protein
MDFERMVGHTKFGQTEAASGKGFTVSGAFGQGPAQGDR